MRPAGLRQGVLQRLIRRSGLRFPGLFALFAGITLLDVAIPDLVPFVDEVGFALLTALFWSWKDRRAAAGSASPRP